MADDTCNDLIPTQVPGCENAYLDDDDIYGAYDKALAKFLWIPDPQGPAKRWRESELKLVDIPHLQLIATQVAVDATPTRADILIRNILNASRIPVVRATPEPAYGATPQTTGRTEASPTSLTVRYPIIALTRTSVTEDHSRDTMSSLRKLAYTSDMKAALGAPWPKPMLYTYQVELMALYDYTMNTMHQAFIRLFRRVGATLNIWHGRPYGNIQVWMSRGTGYTDQTTYEMDAAKAEKFLRVIYTMTIEGWLPQAAYFTPTVLKGDVQLVDAEDGVVLRALKTNLLTGKPD